MELLTEDENIKYEYIEVRPKRSITGIILGGVVPLVLIVITLVYVSIFQKEAVNRFFKKYDIVGVTSAGQTEKNRLYAINNLNVPYEQRQALKNGTIFLGANKEMVELALGAPSEKGKEAKGQEKWFISSLKIPAPHIFTSAKLANW